MRSRDILSVLFFTAGILVTSAHLRSPDHDDLMSLASIPYTSDALADEITTILPGLKAKPSFRQFSGYLPINETKSIFYWFLESERSPEGDPLVYWTNGGPGCSGVLGFFNEHGPFRPTANGESLEVNPLSWNKVANMLYVEQPAGVGFSLARNGTYAKTDAEAAVDNYLSIQVFLGRFPHLRGNELHLTGESYAGHSVPQLAKFIIDKNAEGKDKAINLKGFALGNPLTNVVETTLGTYSTYWGLQLVPHNKYYPWLTKCSINADLQKIRSPECQQLQDAMGAYTDGLNPFALSFPLCPTGFGAPSRHRGLSSAGLLYPRMLSRFTQNFTMEGRKATPQAPPVTSTADAGLPYEPCSWGWTVQYLNRQDVRTAIHANANVSKWEFCSVAVSKAWSSVDMDAPQESLYAFFVKEYKKLRMLIFSGDEDTVCAAPGTQWWIDQQSFKEVGAWGPWKDGGSVAGFLHEWEGNLTFATVRGAGHEVPRYKPKAAMTLFEAYLKGELNKLRV